MAKKKQSRSASKLTGFEESLAELEQVVTELEGGKLGLSDALARYEQGVKHLRTCQELLNKAERRIELLSGVDADGKPITNSFDDRSIDSLEEKAESRGKRRRSSARSQTDRSSVQEDDMDEAGRLF